MSWSQLLCRVLPVVAFPVLALAVPACAVETAPGAVTEAPDTSHVDSEDFVPYAGNGKGDETSATFNKHDIVSDDFFAEQGLDADALQSFLEHTPYGRRSWLADERIAGKRVSEILYTTGKAYGINPVMLLARLQAEQGLVSKSDRPSQSKVDKAFGCGCPDGSGCSSQYRGFDRQVECAAQTMRKLYDASESGAGEWQKARSRSTLDGHSVRPQGHATAAMYAYTPWVLPNRGGNWLVWNVTKKYYQFLDGQGLVVPPSFIGNTCKENRQCEFTINGQAGYCHVGSTSESGVCGASCEGYCPDKNGFATTFCAEIGPTFGVCLPKADAKNDFCGELPGTKRTQLMRYVGQSGAAPISAEVCLPE